ALDLHPQGEDDRRGVHRARQGAGPRLVTAADEGVPLFQGLPLIVPHVCHLSASSGSSRVKRPSLPPRNSSSSTRAIRSVSHSPPEIRIPRFWAPRSSRR